MSRDTHQNVTIGAVSHVDTCDLPSSFAVFRKKQSTKKFEEPSYLNEIVINGRKLPNLCTFLDDSRRKSLFTLVGSPGIGKSTLIKQLLNDTPVLHTIDTVLFFDLSDEAICEQVDNWEDLEWQESLQNMAHSHGDGILIIVENFTDQYLKSNSLVKRILEHECLPESKILIVTRPNFIENMKSICPIDNLLHVKGLTLKGIENYLLVNSRHSEQIMSYLRRNKLLDMCRNPFICSTIVNLFKGRTFEPAKALSKYLHKFLTSVVFRELDSEDKKEALVSALQLEQLPDSVKSSFKVVCEFAMQHLLTCDKCTNLDESLQFLSVFGLKGTSTSKDIFRFCVLYKDEQHGYQFVSSVMAQFLAAFHLYQQPPLNQLYFLYKNCLPLFVRGFKWWLKFFFGLIGEDYLSHITLYNPTKLMMNSVVDILVESLELYTEPEHRYALIECILEAQEMSLIRKVATKYPAILDFYVPQSEFDSCIQPISTLMSNSGYANWILSCRSSNVGLANILKKRTEKVMISITIDDSLTDKIGICPKRTAAEADKVYREVEKASSNRSDEQKAEKFHQYCCRAVREIFQRILPIYSEVKLKGDSSNVSYVSFLTCECFKESFTANVQFFPLQPIHFLDGPVKDFSKIPPSSMSSSDRHNSERHNGKSMEVVIMLRPLLRKIRGVVPITNEQFSIVLSQDLSSKFALENTCENLREVSELVAVMRSVDTLLMDEEHTELVLPSYPIVPKMLTGRAQHAIPKPFFQLPQPPRADPVSILPPIGENVSDCIQGDAQQDSTYSPPPGARIYPQATAFIDTVGPLVHSSQRQHFYEHSRLNLSPAQTGGGTSIQPSHGAFVHTFAAEQAVGEAQQSSRRQANLRQGTVLYTSVPDKIPSDRIQPLPTQHTLIRKGGNGSIFSENVNGLALAVKKTSYRSKEYAIITKIRHKNIVPLLAYVWGEEHKESKRRFFVYHYLPKLSGDMARLVTDKEELSLHDFHKRHHNNPRAMGVAVGNVKYILSQVLQGLNYLHDNHQCIHRDVKASNVLIKFFCNCDNPVQCSCDVKYQVSGVVLVWVCVWFHTFTHIIINLGYNCFAFIVQPSINSSA